MMLAADYTPPTIPPDGPPTNVSIYLYEGFSKVGVQWANGDPLATTEIGFNSTEDVEPTGATDLVGAGSTSWESGDVNRCWFWVRHCRGGQYSAWVVATNVFGCEPDPFEF
jgi:hypothetical protein